MSNPQTDWMLAVFRDRSTIAHERYYRHPIERVWAAVTTSDLQGRPLFSLGGPARREIGGTLTTNEAPNTVQYTFAHPESYVRFELAEAQHPLAYGHVDGALGAGTHVWLVQSYAPGTDAALRDDANDDTDNGADRPAGPDSPWRPAEVAGFHEFLDQLGLWLDGRWFGDDNVAYHDTGAGHDQRARWVNFYRNYIRDNCPPA